VNAATAEPRSKEKDMHDIDLHEAVLITDVVQEHSFRRLAAAAISPVLSDRTFRALAMLHVYASGHTDKLPDINISDLVILKSLSYLDVSDDKTVVTLS
jgi:hypothetical protein